MGRKKLLCRKAPLTLRFTPRNEAANRRSEPSPIQSENGAWMSIRGKPRCSSASSWPLVLPGLAAGAKATDTFSEALFAISFPSIRESDWRSLASYTQAVALQAAEQLTHGFAGKDAWLKDVSPHADVHQQPQTEHHADQRRAAVAHQRKGNACHRQQSADHSNVFEDLPENHRRHADRHKGSEAIARIEGDAHRRQQDAAVERYQQKAHQEPVLLGPDGKDEISVLLGQEKQSRLRSLPPPFSGQPTGSNGN